MNTKFYELSEQKQTSIKNAGYKAFGENVYKKASMKMIADEACISKSLLFHYFKNKQELYEWLFKSVIEELSTDNAIDYDKNSDFFEMIHSVISQRIKTMDRLVLQYKFFIKAYEESIFNDYSDIKLIIAQLAETRKQKVLENIDKSKFKNSDDSAILYDLITDLASGYYERNTYEEWIQGAKALEGFKAYLHSLKKHYYKEF